MSGQRVDAQVLEDGSTFPTAEPELMVRLSTGGLMELVDATLVVLATAARDGTDLAQLARFPVPDGNGEVSLARLWVSGFAAGMIRQVQIGGSDG